MIAWCYEIVLNCNSKYKNFVVVYVYFISMKNSHINYVVVILFMNFVFELFSHICCYEIVINGIILFQ